MMARLKDDYIENKVNEEMALLVRKYIGDDSYRDVAAEVGVDPSTLSYICRGKVKPTIEVLYQLGQYPRNGVYFEDLMAVRFPLATKKVNAHIDNVIGIVFDHGDGDWSIWIDDGIAEQDSRAIKKICKKYTDEGWSVRGQDVREDIEKIMEG